MKNLIYLLIVLLIFDVGCKETGLAPFPSKFVYESINGRPGCTQFEVISQDPLKLSDGVDLDPKLCPASIFGFDSSVTAEVFDWIRDAQENAKQRCK